MLRSCTITFPIAYLSSVWLISGAHISTLLDAVLNETLDSLCDTVGLQTGWTHKWEHWWRLLQHPAVPVERRGWRGNGSACQQMSRSKCLDCWGLRFNFNTTQYLLLMFWRLDIASLLATQTVEGLWWHGLLERKGRGLAVELAACSPRLLLPCQITIKACLQQCCRLRK